MEGLIVIPRELWIGLLILVIAVILIKEHKNDRNRPNGL